MKNEEGSFWEILHMALTRVMQMNSALVTSMIKHYNDSKIVLKITWNCGLTDKHTASD